MSNNDARSIECETSSRLVTREFCWNEVIFGIENAIRNMEKSEDPKHIVMINNYKHILDEVKNLKENDIKKLKSVIENHVKWGLI